MQQQQQHYYYRLCIIKIYIHYKIYTDEMINKMSGQLFSSQQSYQRQPAAFMCTRTQNTQLCGTTAAVVTPHYVYFRIFYYIFFAHSVFVLCCMHSRTCVCTYWGDFDCQNNLCVIFADRRQIHTSTTCLSLFVNTCALTVVVIAPVLNGNRMEIVVEMGFLCVSTQLHSKSAIVLVTSSEDENRTTKLPAKALV